MSIAMHLLLGAVIGAVLGAIGGIILGEIIWRVKRSKLTRLSDEEWREYLRTSEYTGYTGYKAPRGYSGSLSLEEYKKADRKHEKKN